MARPDFVKLPGTNRHENRMQQVKDQRRYPRVRFGRDCRVQIGYRSAFGEGMIENLSPGGLMLRTDMAFEIGRRFGCEFSLDAATLIDLPCTVVSRVGDLFGARFQSGPLSRILVGDAILGALESGVASVLSVHELGGRRILRIAGGLNGRLQGDFMHALAHGGVNEIDVAGVTAVDAAGLDLCVQASGRYGVGLGAQSPCFAEAWKKALAGMPGDPPPEW